MGPPEETAPLSYTRDLYEESGRLARPPDPTMTDSSAKPAETPQEESARVGRASPRIRWMALGALGGWCVVLGFVLLAFLESTNMLARLITSEAKVSLQRYGLDPSIERARIDWMRRSVRLEGVRVEDEEGLLAVEAQDARLVWNLSWKRGFELAHVHVSGGEVELSEAGLRKLQPDGADTPSARSPETALHDLLSQALPGLLVEDLRLRWFEDNRFHDLGLWTVESQRDEQAGWITWKLPPRADLRADGSDTEHRIVGHLDWGREQGPEVRVQARELRVHEVACQDWLARWLPRWQTESLQGALSLDGLWQSGGPAEGERQLRAQLRWTDGFLHLTKPGRERQSLRAFDGHATLAFAGASWAHWQDRNAWDGRLEALGHWAQTDLRVQGVLGRSARSDSFAELWGHTDSIEPNEALAERLGNPKALTDLQGMLAPEGSVELAFGVRFPADWAWRSAERVRLPLALRVRSQGTASLAYVGGPNWRQGGVRNLGFPLRVHDVRGVVVSITDPSRELIARTGLYDIQGKAGEATVAVSGGIWSPRIPRELIASIRANPELSRILVDSRVAIQGKGLSFDDEVRQAFEGLRGSPGVVQVLETYAPQGGSIDLSLEFWGERGKRNAANTIEIQGQGVEARWKPFPIPLRNAEVDVFIQSDGGGRQDGRQWGTYAIVAESSVVAQPIPLQGHFAGMGQQSLRSWTRTELERINLRSSSLSRALTETNAAGREAFEKAHLAGWLSGQIHATQYGLGKPLVAFAHGHPAGEGLTTVPAIFPIETSGLRGSVETRAEVQPRPAAPNGTSGDGTEQGSEAIPRMGPRMNEVRWSARADILGQSGSRLAGFPLALALRVFPDGRWSTAIRTADVGVDSPLIVGAVGQYLANDTRRVEAFDANSIPLAGRISGSCELLFDPQQGKQDPELDLNLELDLDRFGPGGTEILRDLKGQVTLSQRDGSWAGKNLTGFLGDTPVQLHNLEVVPEEGQTRVTVNFSAQGIPIDRRHLQPFLEENLLHTLVQDLGARGSFDLDHGTLTLLLPESGPSALRLQGKVRIHDSFLRLGLPIEVDRVDGLDLDLWYEGNHVRAKGTMTGLDGRVAERELSNARFQFTYVAPKLTIEEFDGEFEGGRLQSLGADAQGAAGFLALDLVHPFRFSLSAAMRDVDVGRLLAGVFNSDFANEGRLDGDMRLSGDVDHLTQVRGSGRASLSDTALWAIPVFQSLFSQLGFDTTATFKVMEGRFRVADGRITVPRMQIKSDLLSLVGTGWVDFEGDLSQDLEVRYSLVDRLGPLTKLLYRIQNSLLRVSIRGDMARPRVHLGGFFSQFFRQRDGARQLPLPGLSPLPERF